MNEIVDRVARAIWPDAFEGDGAGWHQRRDVAKEQARAAIEALLEPTEEMIKAGGVYWDACDGSPIRMAFSPLRPYQAMIKEALK